MESQQVTSGESTQGSAEVAEQTNSDTVAYSSYQKVLGEKKARDHQLAELKERLSKVETEKMEAEGNKDKLLETYKSQLSEKEKALKEKTSQYAWSVLSGQIKTAVLKAGCSQPDKLLKLLDKSDFDMVEVDEGYNVNAEHLTKLVEKARKDNPFMFTKTNTTVNDMTPTNKVETGEKELNQMNKNEIANEMKKSLSSFLK